MNIKSSFGLLVVIVGLFVSPVGAVETISVSVTNGDYVVSSGFQTIDSGIVITATSLDGAKVSISSGFTSGEDRFGYSNVAGITGSYNSSTGVLSFSGTASGADYQAQLRSVQYKNTSSNPTNRSRSFFFSLGAALPNPENGHFYQFVNHGSLLNWTTAKNAAALKTYHGLKGYLVTVTSATEMSFVKSKLSGVGWLGASDSGSEGTWKWMTGPETGLHFYSTTGSCAATDGAAVSGRYHNWDPGTNGCGEPNNSGGEDYGHFHSNGKWNDYPLNGHNVVRKYVVEYGGSVGDPTPILTATVSVDIIEYRITASSNNGGGISPSGVQEYPMNSTPTYTATPSLGFYLSEFQENGVPVGSVNPHTMAQITSDGTIRAVFAQAPRVTIASGSLNGTLSSVGDNYIPHGDNFTVTITPDTHFQIKDVFVDGVSQGVVSSLTLSNVQGDHTISATFENIMHNITTTLSGEGQGAITPPGTLSFRQFFDSASYTIAPQSNMFYISDVIVDGVSQGIQTSVSFFPVMVPHTIEAVISIRPRLDSNFFGTGF
ncbi:hypothetical protein HOH87_00615 [bacterium]|jgi:hypothetical protein|nr:hypothetical protein [bacterium]